MILIGYAGATGRVVDNFICLVGRNDCSAGRQIRHFAAALIDVCPAALKIICTISIVRNVCTAAQIDIDAADSISRRQNFLDRPDDVFCTLGCRLFHAVPSIFCIKGHARIGGLCILCHLPIVLVGDFTGSGRGLRNGFLRLLGSL